jgi:hypothetical protein
MLVFIKRVTSKRFEWCWKREKVSCQKLYKKESLFRLRLRLLHTMLDIILIVCLVVFAVAWLVSNDWDCLMSLWKKSCVVFIMWKHLFGFLLWCFIWVDLAHAYTIFDYKISLLWPLWSFGFWLVIPLYASFNDVLSLCMIMAVIALLVGRSQSFASLHFVLSMTSTHASNS